MDPVIEPGMTPGQRIKLYRRRAGLTQEVCAQLKGVTVSAWRKWESGERSVNTLSDWVDIARILRVRDLYRITGMPVGHLPDDPVDHELVKPLRAAIHAYGPPEIELMPLRELRTAVRLAWTTWHQSRQRYSYTGPSLPGLVQAVTAAVASTDGDSRRDALRISADLYLLVRSYAKRIGAHDVALVAADRALAAARDADDPIYRGAGAWNLGQALSMRGHAEESAELCRSAIAELRAIDDQDPVRLSVLGGLNLLLSVQAARLHNDRDTAVVLSEAEKLAAVVGETTHHWLFFGPINVGIHRAAVALELSRHGEALKLGERVDVTGSPSVERRHSHLLHLARGYATQRDDVAASLMLSRAHQESPEDSRLSLTMRALLRELLARETPTTRPELRSLADQVGVA
ncbi:helix-turn-helix transcriptional regulator [Salinispora arenicola]|uniref:helix-turn-helix domain-containing protein n=1 Tax=Salinispora arenicola TaxID=168697 RepID=UPI000378B1B7|nr:helix-turn-helix transcriptional regulator [Salinispora arenicola]NIL44012.1 helix-turn-helix transcriptional regulator [Salinispora arenicola]